MVIDENVLSKEEETTNLVSSLSTNKSVESQVLFEEQQKLAQTLQECIFKTQSLDEIDAIKKIVASIPPTLEAIRTNIINRKSFPPSKRTPGNKKIEPQRRLFKTKKTFKRNKTLPVPSVKENDIIAISLLHPKCD